MKCFPLRDPPFQFKPSLQPVCKFLVTDCVRKYPVEICHLCNEKAFPKKPEVSLEVCVKSVSVIIALNAHKG